ncbi:ATP-binding protein [Streptomyces sp. NPDC004435]|uniref:ATP-binding protein n=1 Tax=Streptomyces sp. NPDC004435 TaxID=3364701 RepID=UPI00368FC850
MCTIGLLEAAKVDARTSYRSAPVPTWKAVSCVMEAADVSVPELRRFARTTVARWGVLQDDGDLALVVTELVTNAVRHSNGSAVHLLLSATCSTLTVEVRDNGRWRDRVHPEETGGPACGGRGLQLVEASATLVVVQPGLNGTRVIVKLRANVVRADVSGAVGARAGDEVEGLCTARAS